MSGDEDFFSVARTMPFVAVQVSGQNASKSVVSNLPFMPRDVTP